MSYYSSSVVLKSIAFSPLAFVIFCYLFRINIVHFLTLFPNVKAIIDSFILCVLFWGFKGFALYKC